MMEMINQLEKNFENESSLSQNRLVNLETLENLGFNDVKSLPQSGTSKISEINSQKNAEVQVYSNDQILELLKMQVQKLLMEQIMTPKTDERTFIDLGSQTGPVTSQEERQNHGYQGFVHQDIIKSINHARNNSRPESRSFENINYGIIDRNGNLIPHGLYMNSKEEIYTFPPEFLDSKEKNSDSRNIVIENLEQEPSQRRVTARPESSNMNVTSIQMNRDIRSSFQTNQSRGQNGECLTASKKRNVKIYSEISQELGSEVLHTQFDSEQQKRKVEEWERNLEKQNNKQIFSERVYNPKILDTQLSSKFGFFKKISTENMYVTVDDMNKEETPKDEEDIRADVEEQSQDYIRNLSEIESISGGEIF